MNLIDTFLFQKGADFFYHRLVGRVATEYISNNLCSHHLGQQPLDTLCLTMKTFRMKRLLTKITMILCFIKFPIWRKPILWFYKRKYVMIC